MKRSLSIALLALGIAPLASAGINASGFITYVKTGGTYMYDIHLSNTGTENIGTLWYAWMPGQNYLPTMPSSTMNPTGWGAGSITHASGQGYGIRWIASNPLMAGQSTDGFMFTTTDTPAELGGNSPFFPGTPVGMSVVYQGNPFVGDSAMIMLNPVPEPTPFAALGAGLLVLLRRSKKRAF